MKYYLTTPLYYVNAAPHIGHTYTTIAADVIRRFKQMQGYDAVMFTGTDEHGQKVERAAEAAGQRAGGLTPTRIASEFRQQWEKLGLAGGPHHPHHRPAAPQDGAVAFRALPERTATSTRAPTPASTASTTSCT